MQKVLLKVLIPSVAELVPVLQVSIGPVILISGVGLLILSMTNRLGRVIDRGRILDRELRPGSASDSRTASHPYVQGEASAASHRFGHDERTPGSVSDHQSVSRNPAEGQCRRTDPGALFGMPWKSDLLDDRIHSRHQHDAGGVQAGSLRLTSASAPATPERVDVSELHRHVIVPAS